MRTTMSDIRAANKAAGGHFFDRATVRYFGSRHAGGPYSGPGGLLFVTSDTPGVIFGEYIPRDFRVWRVQQVGDKCGHIDLASKAGEPFKTVEEARDFAKRLARGDN